MKTSNMKVLEQAGEANVSSCYRDHANPVQCKRLPPNGEHVETNESYSGNWQRYSSKLLLILTYTCVKISYLFAFACHNKVI